MKGKHKNNNTNNDNTILLNLHSQPLFCFYFFKIGYPKWGL